ncbi:glycoside hydrolase family 2 protein [Dictyobacter formicarum]|uniref:Hydrolase n=1 Tax=Dictyobacter formicarum TaxID=2778368 RepID=A0ABQ3VKL5_9CHLR|nr:sugar-binding domain-containing protein [Dictyobacter formicarum]GHO86368.1 hydrolase [Dictyobacter formicarum]
MGIYSEQENRSRLAYGQRSAYPRPDFDRSHRWLCLNGAWDFSPDPEQQGLAERWEEPGNGNWTQQIQVPFAWETAASGIGQEWLPVGWYRLRLQCPAEWARERTILHFGAVHYLCQVWVNGLWIGEHRGGYLPFCFDITDALRDGCGELIVRVEAPLDKLSIPHGKQRSRPNDDYYECQFTASSGIWQTVWLEGRPETFIQHVRLSPSQGLTAIEACVELRGKSLADTTLSVQIDGMPEQQVPVHDSVVRLTLPVEQPRCWTPQDPYLYYVTVKLVSSAGVDQVKCYTGLRSIEAQGDRLLLNGEPLYVRGALEQGYWPESGYSAPNDDALRLDVEIALQAGFNLMRKHIKLEDPLWLYWADRLGLLVWAEPPCYGRFSQEAAAIFEAQLPLMVARDHNHPSIILWGIYNEEWGLDWRSGQDVDKQQAVIRAYDLLAAHDHSRPIIDDSGWNHVKTDVLDWHYYDNDNQRWRDVTAALASDNTTWFGHQLGVDHWYETQLCVTGHEQQDLPLLNGEYGAGSTDEERGWYFRWQTQELRRHAAISGYIYTELYDVEYELCGLYNAWRQLKPLGYDPKLVNADTVIIFDLVPHKPGLDYIVDQAELAIPYQISHQGSLPIRGQLLWWWESDSAHASHLDLDDVVEPYTITAPQLLRFTLPSAQVSGRLHVQLLDGHGHSCAYAFLDIAPASEAQAEQQPGREGYAFSEKDLPQVNNE